MVRRYKKKKVKLRKVGLARKKIWVVRKGNVTLMMTRKEAEKYMKKHPNVSVYCYVKKYEL